MAQMWSLPLFHLPHDPRPVSNQVISAANFSGVTALLSGLEELAWFGMEWRGGNFEIFVVIGE